MIGNRRGVIGFMVTMAVGIAIGAATLFVGSEIAKGLEEDKGNQKGSVSVISSSALEVEKAFTDYQSAQKDYERAVNQNSPYAQQYLERLHSAKRRLEIALLRNTPGVDQMTLPALETLQTQQPAVEVSAQEQANPFSGGEVTIPIISETDTAQDQLSQSSPELSQSSAAQSGDSSGSVSSSSSADTSGQMLEYVKVHSGDSLWKICEKYYGDGGMWQHILKYQVPSIAATPNLIFPGQLIALPRRLVPSSGAGSETVSTPDSESSDPVQTAPKGDESWENNFQRDNLISDHALTNSGSMSVEQIQSFLDKKGSVLAKPYNGQKPAKMIYDAARKHGINPQVLLTRLQCEQGLISKKTATQKQLDWALGVGCYDSGNWNQKFKGLDKQIEWAAATYKRHYSDAKAKLDKGERITMKIDGQNVVVKNAATYSFYKYCPHFQGNKLFYDVWQGYRKYW